MSHVVYFDTVDGGVWDSVLHLRSGSCTGATAAAAGAFCLVVSGMQRRGMGDPGVARC